MSFFAQPNLSDLQFRQTPNSELSLCGLTKIKTWSGLTLSDGSTGDILVTLSGASSGTTNGFVLTYLNGTVSLQPSGSGSVSTFDTHRETTRVGIPNVCVGGTCTVNNFLEGYFFPAVGPSSALSVASGLASREFGDTSIGNLCYQGLRETHPICLVAIDTTANGSYNCLAVTTQIAGDCCGTAGYTFPFNCATPPSGTSQTSVTYGVCVKSICNEQSITNSNINWRNKVFTFKSSTLYVNASIVPALSSGILASDKNKTLTNEVFNNQFLYHVYPSSFGVPTFNVNGLANTAWGNSASGTLFKINYTNPNGYLNQYYVARSDNRITGTYNINIT
jgi:hypothetical protein